MAFSETLAQRVRARFGKQESIRERRMFGGLCFLVNGNMACGIVGDELMVRVGPEGYEKALGQPHAREMDFTGRPMRAMVYVGTAGVRSEEDLFEWAERGARFAASLPAK